MQELVLCTIGGVSRSFFETLYRLRAILVLTPLFVLSFSNDQMIDIAREYRVSERHFGDRFDLLILTLIVSAGVPLLFIPYRLNRGEGGTPGYDLGRRLSTGLAVLAAVLPGLFFWAELNSGPAGLVATNYIAWNISVGNIAMLAGIICVAFVGFPQVLLVKMAGLWRALRLHYVYLGISTLLLLAYLGLCVLPLAVSNKTLFPLLRSAVQTVGVSPFTGLFLLAVFTLASYSTVIFDKWRIPLLSLIVLAGICFSALRMNSDFNARPLSTTATAKNPVPIADAFRQWLQDRKDYAQYRSANPARPYPVYLIAAAGGGAYAGFHSAYFLARLFETCPRLRHHTFGVSSVSGGALGTALIATATDQKGEDGGELRCDVDPGVDASGPTSGRVEEFFSVDHFSFLVWARLYPDMLRRMLWFNVPELASDPLFEEWLNANWTKISANAYTLGLSDSIYTYWRRDRDAPALFFNVTNTQTGRAEAVSPLHFPRNLPSRKDIDLRIITAASLSFRFPLLNAPGTLPRNSSIPAQGYDPITAYDTLETTATYVDGGYYENSGLNLLNRVKAELERADTGFSTEVRLISFNSVPNQEAVRSSRNEEDTLLAPINALFAARMQRGVDEWEAVIRRHGEYEAHLSLYQDRFHHRLPLGWTLSQQSLTFIKRHFGVPSDCKYTERFWEMVPDNFDQARAYLAERFPPADYGPGMPGIRPRDLRVADANRLVKLDMLSQRIYMGCQMGKIFRNLVGSPRTK